MSRADKQTICTVLFDSSPEQQPNSYVKTELQYFNQKMNACHENPANQPDGHRKQRHDKTSNKPHLCAPFLNE
jgi:hypothetical protein